MAVKSAQKQRRNTKPPKGWPKGKSGNPKGRPKGSYSSRTAADKALRAILDEGGGDAFFDRLRKDFKGTGKDKYAYHALIDHVVGDNVFDRLETIFRKREREDRDFFSYRIHKGCHSVQQQLLLSTEHLRLCMAGRRSGKTEGFVRLAADVKVRHEKAEVLFIGKTSTRCMELFWQPTLDMLDMLGFGVEVKNRSDGLIKTQDGAAFAFKGNANADERQKLRGGKYHLIVVDECQSQAQLKQLVEEIIEPMLIDYGGILALGGTGPRVRGEYWEFLWADNRPALRLNWNISQNPFIKDYDKVLARIRAEKALSETDSLYVREYLGQISYDDDALVIRLKPENYFTDDQLAAWIKSVPVTDVRFVAGLDYGFVDADGFGIICYALNRPERWLVYEYTATRTGVRELAEAVKAGVAYVQSSPLFAGLTEKKFLIYADTGGAGKKIGYDLATQYQLPIQDAYKVNKNLAIELLQDETRQGMLRVRAGGAFDEEAKHTVFRRDEQDRLTREIDDDTFHPNLMDGVCYAMRPVWWFARKVPANAGG